LYEDRLIISERYYKVCRWEYHWN